MSPARAALAAAALAAVSCGGAAPTVQTAPAVQLTAPRRGAARDADPNAARAAVARAEAACRQRLARLPMDVQDAVDRIRARLGAACSVTVDPADALRWMIRCEADRFFVPGEFAFVRADAAGGDARAAAGGPSIWDEVGGVLRPLVGASARAVRVAVVGHVDGIRFDRTLRGCGALGAVWGAPGERFGDVAIEGASPGTPEWVAAQRDANDRLSWCRAAHVAQRIACGLAPGGGRGDAACDDAAPQGQVPRHAAAPVSVFGAGTWLFDHGEVSCDRAACRRASPGQSGFGDRNGPCACPAARSVDVVVQIERADTTVPVPCPATVSGLPEDASPALTLYCAQDCLATGAVRTEGRPAPPRGAACGCAERDATWPHAQRPEGAPGGACPMCPEEARAAISRQR